MTVLAVLVGWLLLSVPVALLVGGAAGLRRKSGNPPLQTPTASVRSAA